MGRFEITIGSQRLFVENIATGLARPQVEEYLRDFQQDLIWLVMGFGTATATSGAPSTDAELVSALTDFASAARRVIDKPALNLREITAETRIAQLRPNAATFRQYARMPAARRLVGRGAEATADIVDNRYLRHMVQVCERLARNVVQSAQRQSASFAARAAMEAARSAEYLAMDSRAVEPEIFDNQQAELKEKLESVASYTDGPIVDGREEIRSVLLKIGRRYASEADKIFCDRVRGRNEEDARLGIRYNVLRVPEDLTSLMLNAAGFGDIYRIRGTVGILDHQPKKDARLIRFSHVVAVVPQALANKQLKREYLEQNGWRVRLSPRERKEVRQEARTAQQRGEIYLRRAARAEEISNLLSLNQTELNWQDRLWQTKGVGLSSLYPTGMRYSRHPDYAACFSAFRRVRELAEPSGAGDAALQAIDRIGILHASALYERWCLVKIISVLIDDYGFTPAAGWQDHLIRAVTGLRESLAVDLYRNDLGMAARLEFQPLLPNGRRPDFRLSFSTGKSPGGESGLVMDAKFRATWRVGELASQLDELVSTKGYGQKGDRVFILQPAAREVARATSPLRWGRDCDYGQDREESHRKGFIHLAPGIGAANPVSHLRRLIALQLQSAFPVPYETEPESDRWISGSFCIRCGSKHESGNVQRHRTERENDFWTLHCTSCEMMTTRTHCYGCGQVLFKNGSHLTYHRTLADQITNVACPHCGKHFDPDWREDSGAFR
jgi:hypothetical protein